MALLVVLLAVTLIGALGTALILNATSETMIAGNFLAGREAGYAADAVLDFALAELSETADWGAVLGGTARSELADGSPAGVRQLPGIRVNLTHIVNLANCAVRTGCTDVPSAPVHGPGSARSDGPRWTPYLYTRLAALTSGHAAAACCYVVALVAEGQAEHDSNRSGAGFEGSLPERDILRVRGEGFAAHGAHAVRLATLSRRGGRPHVLSWRTGLMP